MDATSLRIHLLGGFSVQVEEALVADRAWRLRKARALVKVVALAPGRKVHRDVVSELLWPGRDAPAAANNLHQALHAARRALGDPGALTLHEDVLALTPAAWVDVDAFERAAAAEDPEPALGLYAGELLPEDRFEEWTHEPRARLAELQLDLEVRAAERGDPALAVDRLRRAAARAPRHEPARRALMRALAAGGRRQDALAEFEDLRAALREHTGADPDPETRALYRELLAGAAPGAGGPAEGVGLPQQLTSFVGRSRELAELGRLLERTRLLTLTGPGGAGKTRLGVQAASARAAALPDGAWFADLGGLRDPGLVPQAVALALGLPIPANRPALDALTAHVATRRLLIVLDTCEHLLDACAHLAEALLLAGPGVQVLATSREPLRCAGELAWRVPSLAEAATLFRDRAAAVRPGGWSADEDALIDAVCRRLDRMPLAIELAAARTGALSIAQVADRLDSSLEMLTAGSRTALNRQQTLRATIAWSHDLLTEDERIAFRRLSVLAGSFTLEAAEAVVADEPLEVGRVADLVARLVDKSLVSADGGRFRLMDAIRQFGEQELAASGEESAVARRHLSWCRAAAGGGRSLLELEDDHDDLRAALGWAVRHDPEAAMDLATRLSPFWLARSYFVEATRWLDAVLEASPQRSHARVECLLAAAGMGLRRGDADDYMEYVREAVGIYRDLGDPAAMAEALLQHALFDEYMRSSPASAAMFDEAIATAERLGEMRIAVSAVHGSAVSWANRSALTEARVRLGEVVARLHALPPGPERFLQGVTCGQPVLTQGDGGAPRMVWEATLFMFRRFDRDGGLVLAYNNLAWVARAQGDPEAAREALDAALHTAGRAGDRRAEALTLAHLGHHARTSGDLDEAARRLEASRALFGALGERRDAEVMRLGLGLVRADGGDIEGGRAAMGAALERFLATDDSPAIAGTRQNWALMEERSGDLERAFELYAAAAGGWGGQRLDRIAAWCDIGHGDVAARLGDEATARATWDRAYRYFAGVSELRGREEAAARLSAESPLSGCKEGAT